jgi:membrane protease YdiL (CAAX protease family)
VLTFWQRFPVILRATLMGGAIALTGILPWSTFVLLNQKYWNAIPWAIVPTALWLWLLWKWLGGAGWPRSTSAKRRELRRASDGSPDAFGMAIVAGMIGFAALVPFTLVLNRLVTLNQAKSLGIPPTTPAVTAFLLLVMASIVAGVVEEAAFRGYLQGPIERRHGPAVAILFTGALFGLAHFAHHPGVAVLGMLPFYMFAAAVYGMMAWSTNSIIPGIILHAGGDVFVLTRWWATGKGEWQLTAEPPKLVWETGPDAAFWGALAAFILLGAAATWMFAALASSTTAQHGRTRELHGVT